MGCYPIARMVGVTLLHKCQTYFSGDWGRGGLLVVISYLGG